VGDFHQRNLHLLDGAIVIKAQARKLPRACYIVDFYDCMDFFSGISVRFKADVRFEQLDLKGERRLLFALGRSQHIAWLRWVRKFGRRP